jgi:4-amino-4-deoxy-L-arabinose transferase-like glycosyltransferase
MPSVLREETSTDFAPPMPAVRRQRKSRRVGRAVGYALLLLTVLFFALIRFRLRSMPLERDEGEYAYAGQLILQGIPPYQLAYNMKLPGTYAAYALILAAFGQTSSGIHLGLMLVNACEALIIVLIARRLFGSIGGAVSGASYALLSTSPYVVGLAGHATHFVVVAASAGVLMLLQATRKNNDWLVFGAGVLFGLAFLMKQPGIVFLLFAAVWLLRISPGDQGRWAARIRPVVILIAGALLPFVITCALLLKAGVFPKFWFWTFSYASKYAAAVPLSAAWPVFWKVFPHIVKSGLGLWVIAALGLTAFLWSSAARKDAFFLATFLVFSLLGVSIGFRFRPHYFVLMLPAVSLLVGAAVEYATLKCSNRGSMRGLRWAPACLFLLVFCYSILQQRNFFFGMTPYALARYIYGANPFPQAVQVGQYLREHSPESARIAVLGSEPEIYFYSHRHSGTGYIYTYPMQENQPYAVTMQEEMANEIETAKPEYLVYVNVSDSWSEESPKLNLIFAWARSYISDYYREIKSVTIPNPGEESVDNSSPPGSHWSIYILQRKPE